MEKWRDIAGYEGRYQVSNEGRVRSLDRTVWGIDGKSQRWPGKMLTPVLHSDGYRRVKLHGSGARRKVKSVHSLVAEAFIGPCPAGMEVCHNDGNPANNCVENLRYDTHYNNLQDCVSKGTGIGTAMLRSRLPQNKISELLCRSAAGEPMVRLGVEFGVSTRTVRLLKQGKGLGVILPRSA
jgi:hypothetical protein